MGAQAVKLFCIVAMSSYRAMLPTKCQILYALRDDILEFTTHHAERQFEGIQQGARFLRNQGMIDKDMCKVLMNIDVTYNLMRHLTSTSAGKLMCSLQAQVAQHQATPSSRHSSLATAEGDPDT